MYLTFVRKEYQIINTSMTSNRVDILVPAIWIDTAPGPVSKCYKLSTIQKQHKDILDNSIWLLQLFFYLPFIILNWFAPSNNVERCQFHKTDC